VGRRNGELGGASVVLLELDPGSFVGGPADIPDWANRAAVIGRALVVVLSLTAGVASRGAPRPGVAVGALMPVAFLLTNRIFSTQLLVLIPVAWAVAGARLARSRRAGSSWPGRHGPPRCATRSSIRRRSIFRSRRLPRCLDLPSPQPLGCSGRRRRRTIGSAAPCRGERSPARDDR
jgi:hypothetical protein